jgi:TolB-like protein
MNRSFKHLFIVLFECVLTLLTPLFTFASGDALIFAQASSGKGIMSNLFGKQDTTPPDIELDDLENGQTVYTGELYISGRVTDAGTVKNLTVNEIPVMTAEGRSIIFSHLAALREGKNIVTIEARDDAGNTAKKDITVIREDLRLSRLPQEIIKQRMRLAVYPFDQKGVVSETSSILMDMLTKALQDQHRFQLIERASLDRALEEQKLGLTQVVDRNAALNVGKLMSAQAIVTGSIMESEEGIEIVGRMIDTETSGILATEKMYSAKNGIDGISFLAQALASKFCNDIPMLGGVVVKRNGDSIFTSLGKGKVSQNSRIIIYRDNGSKSVILGHGRITQVSGDMSKAALIQGSINDIREMDWVIVQ